MSLQTHNPAIPPFKRNHSGMTKTTTPALTGEPCNWVLAEDENSLKSK